jgi:type VI protein secretion system component VasK
MEISGKRIKLFLNFVCVLFIWWLLRGWINRAGIWWDKTFWRELPKHLGISTGVFAFLVMITWILWHWNQWRNRLKDDIPKSLFGEKSTKSDGRFEEPRSDE